MSCQKNIAPCIYKDNNYFMYHREHLNLQRTTAWSLPSEQPVTQSSRNHDRLMWKFKTAILSNKNEAAEPLQKKKERYR